MKPVRCVKVLLLNAEDDKDELRRRLLGACEALDISVSDVSGNVLTLDARRLTLVARNAEGKITKTDLGRKLLGLCSDNGIGLLVFDPLVEGQTGLDENSAEMTELIFALRDVARLLSIPVLIIHHSRKSGTDGDQDSSRGSSAITNACRTVLTLTPMARDDAASLLGKERIDDHWRFIRVSGAKSNYAARGLSKWLEIKSVAIGNGTPMDGDGTHTGDEVPMLVPADFGRAIDPQDWPRRQEFLRRLAAGRGQGKHFAISGPGNVYALLENDFGLTRKQSEPLIEALKAQGAIEEREYTKPDRHRAKGLFVAAHNKAEGSHEFQF